MLSPFTLKGIQWFIKGGERLRLSMFAWDTSLNQMNVTKSKLTWYIMVTLIVYCLMQFCFEITQIYRLAGDPEEPFASYMKLLAQCVTRMLGVIVILDTIWYGRNKANFFNQICVLNKQFQGVKGGGKLKDTMKTLTVAVNLMVFGHPFLTALDFFNERYQSRYWHHLVIPEPVFAFTVPFFCVVEYMLTAQAFLAAIWYLYLGTLYFRTSSAWMQLIIKLKYDFGPDWKTDCLSLFRTMQVYNRIYKNRMAFLWTYQIAGIFIIEVIGVVNSLRLVHVMPFPQNLMFPVAATSAFFYSTRIYKATIVACDISQDLANKYKNSRDKYKKVLGASMAKLQVEARPFFVMKRTTSFSFTNEVADKSVSILLLG